MRTILAMMLVLSAGCQFGGGVHLATYTSLKADQVVELGDIHVSPPRTFTIRIRNLGPDRPADREGELEVSNGDQLLGRVRLGDEASFETSGEQIKLKVRAVGAPTRLEADVWGTRP